MCETSPARAGSAQGHEGGIAETMTDIQLEAPAQANRTDGRGRPPMTTDNYRTNFCQRHRKIGKVLARPTMRRKPIDPAFAAAITEAREDLRLKQGELAKAIGVGVNTVNKWEKGRTGIHRRNKAKVIDYLGIEEPKVQVDN